MGNNNRRVIAVASAALLMLAIAAPAVAQDADYLQRIKDAGVIRMSTDGLYPPQSELTPDGNYVGFDIDVGTEIASRLGVEIEFTEPAWELLTAGSWGDRWDFSVGSMTITSPRQKVIDFTQPYYFTPAQLAAHADLGYTSVDELAGKTICMGAATTYLDWMGGTLDFGTESSTASPPEGSVATSLPTDGLPVVALGEPVFYEPLAAAFDKGVEDNDSLVAAVDAIIGEMHADGTLTELSIKHYGEDLTKRVGGDTEDEG